MGSSIAWPFTGFPNRRSRSLRINVVITPAVRERTDTTSSTPRSPPVLADVAATARSVRSRPRRRPWPAICGRLCACSALPRPYAIARPSHTGLGGPLGPLARDGTRRMRSYGRMSHGRVPRLWRLPWTPLLLRRMRRLRWRLRRMWRWLRRRHLLDMDAVWLDLQLLV